MLKRINDFLAGLPMTIIGGVLLVFSFALPRTGVNLPVDPAWGTVVISGIPLLYLAVWRIIYNPGISKISSALLITIAMFAAIAIGDLFAAGEVAFIMAIGALLEDATTNRAKKGLKKLISLAPTQGRRIRDGKEEMIPAEKIVKGDMLRILPGETVPVDGVIVSGETSVDQSIMTGESLPVDKAAGDKESLVTPVRGEQRLPCPFCPRPGKVYRQQTVKFFKGCPTAVNTTVLPPVRQHPQDGIPLPAHISRGTTAHPQTRPPAPCRLARNYSAAPVPHHHNG